MGISGWLRITTVSPVLRWVLPRGGDAASVDTWERPYRDLATPATPRDIVLMAQPVLTPVFPQQHVWVDNGTVRCCWLARA